MNTLLLRTTGLRAFPRIFTTRVYLRCYTVAGKDDNPVPSELRDSPVKSRLFRFAYWALNSRKAHLEDAAVNLYHSVNDVNMREFFTVCKMPDTFQSFFTIHLLHFWMCLVRLNKEGDDGAAISKSMSKIFWQDMRDRMGMLGPMKPKVTRNNRKILDSQFFMDILSYDEAIVSHDIVLASIMWRKFLSTSDAAKADPVLLALLVEYVRKQVHHLDHISSEQLLKDGKITWLPLTSDHYSIK